MGQGIGQKWRSQATWQGTREKGAFTTLPAIDLLPALQRIFIAASRIKALLPSAIQPTSAEHRAEMTGACCKSAALRPSRVMSTASITSTDSALKTPPGCT